MTSIKYHLELIGAIERTVSEINRYRIEFCESLNQTALDLNELNTVHVVTENDLIEG